MRSKLIVLSSLLLLLTSCTQTYVVTFNGSTGGTVSDMGGEYDEGTTISVSAQPQTGYEFQGWSDGSTQNPRTITVSESLNLTALFAKQEFTVTVNIQGEGSVVDQNGNSPGNYEFGDDVRLEPISGEGYHFAGWEFSLNLEGLDSNNNPEYQAYFNKLQASITSFNAANSAFYQQYAFYVSYIEEIQAEINNTNQYYILNPINEESDLSDNSLVLALQNINRLIQPPALLSLVMISNFSLTAKFEKSKSIMVAYSKTKGKIKVNNSQATNAYFLLDDFNSLVNIESEPIEGWEFKNWTGSTESNENPFSVTLNENLDSPILIEANFQRKKYSVGITVIGEGTVTEEVVVQPSQYDFESQVKLTAIPEDSWEFSKWTGDIESTENPITISIDGQKDITVEFVKKDSDKDGVPDDIDECPGTPEGVKVDELGCALDSDGDGVNDDVDQCLDTPVGVEVDENGCAASQKDTDGDGLTDDVDSCPTEGGTYVDSTGCPLPPIKMHSNGVTIVAEDWAEVGTTYQLNGKTYKIVDRVMLDDMIIKGEDLSSAVTTKITSFGDLFYQKSVSSSNQNIGGWDTSNVTNMSNLFWQSNMNPDLSLWDVKKVTNMYSIFFNSAFSGDVSNWKTESLTEMRFAFGNTTVFNSDLNDWDVSKVTDMSSVFTNATGFNKPLDKWDVSNVTNMAQMFFNAQMFNQDISNWCVKNIFAEPFQFYYNFVTASNSFNSSFKPKWGTCPGDSSSDGDSSDSNATGDTSGVISFTRYSEAKACINNVCDVTLGLRFSNGTSASLSVSKIEVYTNGSLTTNYNAGDALGTYEAGQSKSFSISLDNATSGKIIVYYTQNGSPSTKEYNWTNQ
jgi:surface protein